MTRLCYPLRALWLWPLILCICGCTIRVERSWRADSSSNAEVRLAAKMGQLQSRVSFDDPIRLEADCSPAPDQWGKVSHANVLAKDEDGGQVYIAFVRPREGPLQDRDHLFAVSNAAGRMACVVRQEEGRGELVLEPSASFLASCQRAFDHTPTIQQLLTLTAGDSADEVVPLAQARFRPSLDEAIRLALAGVELEAVRAFEEAGFQLGTEAHLELRRHRVDPLVAQAWKRTLPGVETKDLIYARQRDLAPETHAAWKEVGYDLSMEELYFVRSRRLDPAAAAAWSRIGPPLSLEELYQMRVRQLAPELALAWREQGYELTAAELYQVKTRQVTPEWAAAW